jgi:high-affinity iron transporter
MSSAFIQAAVILLREGLEAMLVIAALAGYLTKVGAGHRIQALYGGALQPSEPASSQPGCLRC